MGHVRRSEIMTLGGSVAVIDDEWRVHGDIHPGYGLWTGSTTFTVGRAVDEEDLGDGEDDGHHGEEGEESERQEPSDDDGGDQQQDDRGAGGAGGSDSEGYGGRRSAEEPEPEATYRAPNEEAKECAESYVKKIQEGFGNQADDWAKLVDLGNKLLTAAGSVKKAAESLCKVREEKGLSNLAGVKDQRLDAVLPVDQIRLF